MDGEDGPAGEPADLGADARDGDGAAHCAAGVTMPPIPFLEEPINVSARMPRGLVTALEEHLHRLRKEGRVGVRFTRSDLIREILERYLEEQTFEK